MIWWLLAQAAPLPTRVPPPSPAPTNTPVPRRPVTGVDLRAGESMIVRVGEDGTVAVVDGHPGERRAAPDEVRLDLRVAQGQSYLTAINPDARFLLYRAFIVRAGARPQPTSICPVLPQGKIGIEHWPYAIEGLVLYGFRHVERPTAGCR